MTEKKRNTLQRQLILTAVKELGKHPTAEQVYEYLIKTHPTISKATVYRNLNQMAESGEVSDIGNFHGATHYDHKCHDHYHFICNQCKRIFDIEEEVADIINKLKCKEGFKITSCNVVLNGFCQDCK